MFALLGRKKGGRAACDLLIELRCMHGQVCIYRPLQAAVPVTLSTLRPHNPVPPLPPLAYLACVQVYFMNRVPPNTLHMLRREIELHIGLAHRNIM